MNKITPAIYLQYTTLSVLSQDVHVLTIPAGTCKINKVMLNLVIKFLSN
jgi:hypothetical protein